MDERQSTSARPDSVRGSDSGIEPSSFEQPRPVSGKARTEGLHVCPACRSELVYPLTWEPVTGRQWSVTLRCPECAWIGGGIYGQGAVDRLDDLLDRGTEEMLEDLKALWWANMEDEVNRFVAALEADQILPEDF
ncbi:MAG TPA: hypothetical protein VK919_11310 [Solirubrobacterales bacterium]|nr:hypothetical protein [Solirubrobacterales bacterium]